jgi:4-hydroxy-3-polyprenylbenzoate decarboxylase
MSTAAERPIVMAVTGASGAPYAVRLLETLVERKQRVSLIVSDHGLRLLDTEMGIGSVGQLRDQVGAQVWDACVHVYDDRDRGAAPASGSALSAGMVICPCSMGTVSAIAVGASRSLVERAADVALKERRRLILVPRETPYSAIHLENMLTLTRAGAVVLPASPGFYHRPRAIDDLVNFVVARVLDHLGVEHSLVPRWGSEAPE